MYVCVAHAYSTYENKRKHYQIPGTEATGSLYVVLGITPRFSGRSVNALLLSHLSRFFRLKFCAQCEARTKADFLPYC